jgi:hypothetical protein
MAHAGITNLEIFKKHVKRRDFLCINRIVLMHFFEVLKRFCTRKVTILNTLTTNTMINLKILFTYDKPTFFFPAFSYEKTAPKTESPPKKAEKRPKKRAAGGKNTAENDANEGDMFCAFFYFIYVFFKFFKKTGCHQSNIFLFRYYTYLKVKKTLISSRKIIIINQKLTFLVKK